MLLPLTLHIGPILLGGDERTSQLEDSQTLPIHSDEGQVKLDVHRAFVYYPTGLISLRGLHTKCHTETDCRRIREAD